MYKCARLRSNSTTFCDGRCTICMQKNPKFYGQGASLPRPLFHWGGGHHAVQTKNSLGGFLFPSPEIFFNVGPFRSFAK